MNETTADEWAERKQRVLEYMERWRAERDEALRKKRPMKVPAYEYKEQER